MKFMQIKPQKARGKFLESFWTDPAWSAENKEDGDRRILQMCAEALYLTGTRESVDGTGFVEKSANVPHLTERQPVKPLVGTVLDGEIVVPFGREKDLKGGLSKYVTSVMGSLPEEARRKQRESGHLCYVAFDCLWFKGDDVRGEPLHVRKDHLYEALKLWGNSYVKISHGYTSESEKRRAWEHALEGVVFKHRDHLYGDEKLWVKLKKQATADVVVMGFEPGKGKYAGSVGAIIFGQYRYRSGVLTLDQCGTCRGFTDTQMNAFHKSPKKFVGRTFRITHNGREPTGKFRHPRFDCWRLDKDPHDCIWYPEES